MTIPSAPGEDLISRGKSSRSEGWNGLFGELSFYAERHVAGMVNVFLNIYECGREDCFLELDI